MALINHREQNVKPLRPDLQEKLDVLLAEIEAAGGLEAYYDSKFGAGAYASEQKLYGLSPDQMMAFAAAWNEVMVQ